MIPSIVAARIEKPLVTSVLAKASRAMYGCCGLTRSSRHELLGQPRGLQLTMFSFGYRTDASIWQHMIHDLDIFVPWGDCRPKYAGGPKVALIRPARPEISPTAEFLT